MNKHAKAFIALEPLEGRKLSDAYKDFRSWVGTQLGIRPDKVYVISPRSVLAEELCRAGYVINKKKGAQTIELKTINIA